MDNITIEKLDQKGFQELVATHPDVRLYDKGGSNRASDHTKKLASLVKEGLDKDFRYLLAMRNVSSAFKHISHPGLDQDVFVCAVHTKEAKRVLVGFAHIEHFDAEGLSPNVLERMKASGSLDLAERGYDCMTVMSVHAPYREQGVAGAMAAACADVALDRHRWRGGVGPALMTLSSFTYLGRERLVGVFQKLAAARADVVFAYSSQDASDLGPWAQGPDQAKPKTLAKRPVMTL